MRVPWPARSVLSGAAGTAALSASYKIDHRLHPLRRRRLAVPWASLAFGATLMSLTLTMFPLLGRTPPPWRWPRGYLATSFATHAAYVATVATVDARAQRLAWGSM